MITKLGLSVAHAGRRDHKPTSRKCQMFVMLPLLLLLLMMAMMMAMATSPHRRRGTIPQTRGRTHARSSTRTHARNDTHTPFRMGPSSSGTRSAVSILIGRGILLPWVNRPECRPASNAGRSTGLLFTPSRSFLPLEERVCVACGSVCVCGSTRSRYPHIFCPFHLTVSVTSGIFLQNLFAPSKSRQLSIMVETANPSGSCVRSLAMCISLSHVLFCILNRWKMPTGEYINLLTVFTISYSIWFHIQIPMNQ